jgi:hypothetical protein
MSTIEAERQRDGYALGRTTGEYERLRGQARVWEAATGRLLDQVGLMTGASCLDAGCGPGETMRARWRFSAAAWRACSRPGCCRSGSNGSW